MAVKRLAMALICLMLVACQHVGAASRTLAQFSPANSQCYDRTTQSHHFVVDAHHHFKPFWGQAVAFDKLVDWAANSGVLFVNIYGIGQTYQRKPNCVGERGCYSNIIAPTLENDRKNAAQLLAYDGNKVHLTLSMTFADLNRPATILPTMQALQEQYGDVFSWMGEVNMVKAAQFDNGHQAVSLATIAQWQPFMAALREQNIPLAIHADLGDNQQPLRYLPLLQAMLAQYPENDIVWMHMGLSKELSDISPQLHIETLTQLFQQYPKFKADLSWRILYDFYFHEPQIAKQYVELLNAYPERFLPGTDFVASSNKRLADYREEVAVNSHLFKAVNDAAFRRIALGQNYFDLLKLPYKAPKICATAAP
ncbi:MULTISPECIES: amidohydrolase family protein [unclassified Pseudoalteromonas]|uniref:amidohydrolase family protein n=1 Tax=unclassified Pseudoalteromonas TaxID=194690 RepID=UPI003014DDEF